MFSLRYRSLDYIVAERPELATGGIIPWCIDVDGARYRLEASDSDEAERAAGAFLRARLTNAVAPRTPVFIATSRSPLLLLIDRVPIRAWPQFVARGTGASTFLHPMLNRRVGTERGPVWMFESAGRPASEGGTTTAEQTIDDVIDLATIWFRSNC